MVIFCKLNFEGEHISALDSLFSLSAERGKGYLALASFTLTTDDGWKRMMKLELGF